MDAIAAAHVICQTGQVLSPGWVGFEDGVITEVGSGSPPSELDAHRGGPCSILMPGLVNAHVHLGLGHLRHVADDLPFESWLLQGILPGIEAGMEDPGVFRAGAHHSARELLAGGVTLVADSFLRTEGIEALQHTGQKGVFFQEVFGSRARDEDAYMEELGRDLDALPERLDGFPFGYSPHSPYTCPARTFQWTVARARTEGRRVAIHLDETADEHAFFTEGVGPMHETFARQGNLERYRFGQTPTAYLDGLGVLGPDVLAAHCVQVTEDDIRILSDRGVCVVHCPTSNMKLAEGVAPIGAMLDAGVPLALGTDSAASAGKLDMFQEMRGFVHVQRGVFRRIDGLSASRALDMATRGGAAALGLEDVTGTLQVGLAADLVLLETDQLRHGPWGDPEAVVVYTGTPDDVALVVIDGMVRHRGPSR